MLNVRFYLFLLNIIRILLFKILNLVKYLFSENQTVNIYIFKVQEYYKIILGFSPKTD